MKISIPPEVIREITDTSTSPEHLIQLICKAVKVYTEYTISFYSYPCAFDICVSNSHNAPKTYPTNWTRDSGKSLGYPGWEGSWKGTITKQNKPCTISFSDLTSILPFMKTGSGTSGSNFSISGQLFLYDFPLMSHLYQQTMDINKKTAIDNYKKAVSDYVKSYERYENRYVQDHKNYIEFNKLKNEIDNMSATLSKASVHTVSAIKDEFNSLYGKELPSPPFPALIDNKVGLYHAYCNYNGSRYLPELQPIINRLDTIIKDYKNYIENNPELLL